MKIDLSDTRVILTEDAAHVLNTGTAPDHIGPGSVPHDMSAAFSFDLANA
jgi:hypothetical protein